MTYSTDVETPKTPGVIPNDGSPEYVHYIVQCTLYYTHWENSDLHTVLSKNIKHILGNKST